MNSELIKILDKNLLISKQIQELSSKKNKLLKVELPSKYSRQPHYLKLIPYILYLIVAYILLLVLKNLNLPQLILNLLASKLSDTMQTFLEEVFSSSFFNGTLAIIYVLIVLANWGIAHRWSNKFYDTICKKRIADRKLFIKEESKRLNHKYSDELNEISTSIDDLCKSSDLHCQFLVPQKIEEMKIIASTHKINFIDECISIFSKKEFESKIIQKLDTIIELQKELIHHVVE